MKKVSKLQLNRETLRRLDPREIAAVNGGKEWTGCLSDCTECGTRGVLLADGTA